jgi:hypothetical protein
MSDEDDLRRIVISVLRSRGCRDIAFKNAGVSIMGYGYGYVADMLEQLKVGIVLGNTGGFTATYDERTNTFTFGANALREAMTPGGRGTIVHEATHAVIDAVAPGRNIGYGEEEVSAYLAQTIYSLNCGDRINTVGPLAGPAYEIAQRIRNFPAQKEGHIYECTATEIAAMKDVILKVYGRLAQLRGQQLPAFNHPDGIPNQTLPPMVPNP